MTELGDLPLIEQSSPLRVKLALHSAFFYWRERHAMTVAVPIALGCGMASAGYLLFNFRDTALRHPVTKHAVVLLIPEVSSSSNPIPQPISTFTEYSRTQEARRLGNSSAAESHRAKVTIKLLGPALIVRPRGVMIPPGAIVRARLTSGGGNGRVQAKLLDALRFQNEVLIEQGSILIGQGSSTEDRLQIRFTKLLSPDGSVESIQAEAADLSDKLSGIKGSLVSSRGTKLAASIGLNFVSGAAAALQDSEGQWGATIHPPNLKDAALQGSAQASLDQSREMMDEMKNTKLEVRVPEGSEFYVFFDGEESSHGK